MAFYINTLHFSAKPLQLCFYQESSVAFIPQTSLWVFRHKFITTDAIADIAVMSNIIGNLIYGIVYRLKNNLHHLVNDSIDVAPYPVHLIQISQPECWKRFYIFKNGYKGKMTCFAFVSYLVITIVR